MKFTIVLLGAPYSAAASATALRYCRALLSGGHRIERLFLYGDGVHNATSLASPPQDETDLPAQWASLIRDNQLDAVVCIGAALRRGVIDERERERYHKLAANLGAAFSLSGLGQLISASCASDRTITFGA